MGRITELLIAAHARSKAQAWPYLGALLPHEAHELLQLAPGAQLIDVRSRAELELTGTLPGAVHVEWQSWPGWVINPHFPAQLKQAVDPESLLFFICRSGQRSHRAAIVGTEAGLRHCYNVLEGFEGDLDKSSGHRNALNGWRQRGLPWTQT
ncbi:MAG TPA: rhodanese-like domain-containing protein [Thiobacillus sp.]|nr:MAG: rhodanese [Hydrogenophilales bacterium 28-61-11]OYZ56319.1 MAG: rhodanese [Hydrogenophilales bacterium 16-61-112]OZA48279.1 MAG: rhodanese [Hydrogenophilales bacterium 17-61-76]HQT29837.1 rhodanese-like domain-containing protein [Thiobacillus sp.]HQT69436.1 rhodanese-like domain-containing protein [Thiobacillus sp.]